MSFTVETLLELKEFFDINFEATTSSLRKFDSERLIHSKVNGFLNALQDRLVSLGCGQPQNKTEN